MSSQLEINFWNNMNIKHNDSYKHWCPQSIKDTIDEEVEENKVSNFKSNFGMSIFLKESTHRGVSHEAIQVVSYITHSPSCLHGLR